ncbi:tetratricopeptide repeat protein [Hydrocoleum sp. CS-953]|uniref:tetratricopeptide repeat protein n=1 Tax=Microcoleaceae TaxID=1892252 RepID=UPI000B9A6EB2|nr:tetratricopeptide repeat protein [Hydrocoleum sp. CS-953]OZH55236.1 hypothetical protein AFK68_05900 [Hydrocoleum sp. CS-953]
MWLFVLVMLYICIPNLFAYYYRDLDYIQLENYGEVVEDLTKVVQLDYSRAPAYNYRGNAYYKFAKSQQAVDNYEQAVKLGLSEAVIAIPTRSKVENSFVLGVGSRGVG